MKKSFSLFKNIATSFLLGTIFITSCQKIMVEEVIQKDETDLVVPEQAKCIVTFLLTKIDGTIFTKTVTAEKGKRLTDYDYPIYKSENGIYFSGWCLDSKYTIRYNFSRETIQGNLTLYGKQSPDFDFRNDGDDLILAGIGGYKEIQEKNINIPGIYNGVQPELKGKKITCIWGYDYDKKTEEVYAEGFKNCDFIEKVEIGEGIKSIGKESFYNCKNISQLSLPSSLETIGVEAFNNCEKLTSIEIPENVSLIDVGAFKYCNLNNITFKGTVKTISLDAFYYNYCKKITVDAEVIKRKAFSFIKEPEEINIKKSIKTIDVNAFDKYMKWNYEGSSEEWDQVIKTHYDSSDLNSVGESELNKIKINYNVEMD